MSFNLRVASDNDESNDSTASGAHNFKEFSILPSSGLIPPQSQIKLLVEFVPHFIKKYDTFLIVDIDDVGNDIFNLPISARSVVPSIDVLTQQIVMDRCFIFHSYEKIVKLSNTTSLKARYFIQPSQNDDPFYFTSAQLEGVIEPNSVKEISVYAQARHLGDIEGDLCIKINGSVEESLKVNFTCLSQGPVVQIYPREIDWGQTMVLNDSAREITFSNESLIEAKFSIYMVII